MPTQMVNEMTRDIKTILNGYGLVHVNTEFYPPSFLPVIGIDTIITYKYPKESTQYKQAIIVPWNGNDDSDFHMNLIEILTEWLEEETSDEY